MKNFTNNFKQFTSRLSARWLIMALMMLAGSSSALAYDQSAVDLYFDNSEAKWTNCYVYIGHGSYTSCYAMSRVSGTQYLWKLASNFNGGNKWGGASGWVVSKEKWWDSKNSEDIYKFVYHGNNNVTDISTNAWNATTIYKADGTTNVNHYSTNCTVYKFSTSTKSNYTVTINTVTGGTLTVKDYDNNAVSSGASKIKLTVLKFSESASPGYSLQEVKINNGSTTTTILAADLGTTYTLKSNVTITPVWKKDCTPPTLTLNKTSASVNKGETVNLTTLSEATVTSGTIEWSTSETGTPVISEEQKIDATKKYYARAVGDCKSPAQDFTVNVACEEDFYLVGASSDIFGDVWNPAQTVNKMDCNLNVRTKTYTNVTLSKGTYEYKYSDSKGWQGSQYPSDGTNKSFTIAEDGVYNITFTATGTSKSITGSEVTVESACDDVTFSWETAPVNMNYGETKNIVATLNPAEAGTVSYTASPEGIITFSDNQYTAVGKGDVTITATANLNDDYCPVSDLIKSIKVTCPTPDQPKLSEGKAILDNCGNVVDGIILIENYANYGVGYTFELDDTSIRPANDGTISVSTAKEYIVKVTNECGTSNQASVTITKTTIRAPKTDFEVSISYPQVAYANNNGSINIDLSGSERNVKYYLYKDGREVVDSEKTGDGKGLRWEGIKETGTYTVKAYNPCDLGKIGMTSSVDYTCMSNLNIAFADDKTTFCPGEKTTVTITFTGTGKGDEITNAGKFGWQWTGSNYDYESVYLTESGITMPVTINANGSIQLNVKTCNGTLSSNTLDFTVVTAPEKPVLDKYSNEICTAESAEITISPYNDSYNYNLYKGEQKVDTPEFNAGVFTVSEAGSYTVKAVEAECSLASAPSDPFTLTTRGTTITPSVAEIHPYEVVNFTAGEQAKWALYTNPSSGSQLSDDDAKYSGKDTAYITKGESTTTTFKGEVANGYVIHATVGDCTASYTFNVVEDPDNCQ